MKRTTDKSGLSAYFQSSASRTRFICAAAPAVNCWAIFIRPLQRTKTFFSERKLHSQLQLPGIADALAQEAVEVEQRCGGQRVNVVLAVEGIEHLDDWG